MAMRGRVVAVVALLWLTEMATARSLHQKRSVDVNISLVNELQERMVYSCWSRFGEFLWRKVEAGGEYRLTVRGGNRAEDEFSCGADWAKRFASWPVIEAGRPLKTNVFWKVQYDGVYKRSDDGSKWFFSSPWTFNI